MKTKIKNFIHKLMSPKKSGKTIISQCLSIFLIVGILFFIHNYQIDYAKKDNDYIPLNGLLIKPSNEATIENYKTFNCESDGKKYGRKMKKKFIRSSTLIITNLIANLETERGATLVFCEDFKSTYGFFTSERKELTSYVEEEGVYITEGFGEYRKAGNYVTVYKNNPYPEQATELDFLIKGVLKPAKKQYSIDNYIFLPLHYIEQMSGLDVRLRTQAICFYNSSINRFELQKAQEGVIDFELKSRCSEVFNDTIVEATVFPILNSYLWVSLIIMGVSIFILTFERGLLELSSDNIKKIYYASKGKIIIDYSIRSILLILISYGVVLLVNMMANFITFCLTGVIVTYDFINIAAFLIMVLSTTLAAISSKLVNIKRLQTFKEMN